MKSTKKSPEFEKNKGKISQFATHEARVAGGKASQAVQKKKNAMREALEIVMRMKTSQKRAKYLREQFPELKNVEIDGYVEAAALLRDQAGQTYKASAKLIEIMGGSLAKEEDESDKSRVVNIVVAKPEDAKALADI